MNGTQIRFACVCQDLGGTACSCCTILPGDACFFSPKTRYKGYVRYQTNIREDPKIKCSKSEAAERYPVSSAVGLELVFIWYQLSAAARDRVSNRVLAATKTKNVVASHVRDAWSRRCGYHVTSCPVPGRGATYGGERFFSNEWRSMTKNTLRTRQQRKRDVPPARHPLPLKFCLLLSVYDCMCVTPFLRLHNMKIWVSFSCLLLQAILSHTSFACHKNGEREEESGKGNGL